MWQITVSFLVLILHLWHWSYGSDLGLDLVALSLILVSIHQSRLLSTLLVGALISVIWYELSEETNLKSLN